MIRAGTLVVGILLLAAALRLHNLETQSLWNDEGSSYVQATRSFSEIAVNAAADIHPPGYYWVLKLWRDVVGESEFALRYISALAGVLTAAFGYGIATRLYPGGYGRVAGVVAAGLIALNTFSIFYSQEARMYALLALWASGSMWALAGLMYNPNTKNALQLGIFNALGLWTQYAFPLVMLAQGGVALLWLSTHRRKKRALTAYISANLLAIALFSPLLPTAWRQVTTWPNTGEPIPYPEALGTVVNWLAIGITYPEANSTWIAIMFILMLFGLRSNTRRWAFPLLPILWVVIPVSIFVGTGLFREGNIKFLLPSQVGFALAVGQGVASLWWMGNAGKAHSPYTAPTMESDVVRKGREQHLRLVRQFTRTTAIVALGAVIVNILVSLPALYTNPDYLRDDYRAITASIQTGLDDRDAIILNAPGQNEVFSYYYQGQIEPLRIPFGLNDTDETIQTATEAVVAQADDIYLVLWGDQERDPNGIVERTLDENAFEISNTWYGDVRLARYTTAAPRFDVTYDYELNILFGDVIRLDSYALSTRTLSPGDVLQVRLNWQAWQQIDTRYKVTLQLVDAEGRLVAQRDAEPGGGQAPTDTWEMGQTVTDNHALLIPADIAEANFTLILALYNSADSQQRLPVTQERNDYLTLTTITVTHPEES